MSLNSYKISIRYVLFDFRIWFLTLYTRQYNPPCWFNCGSGTLGKPSRTSRKTTVFVQDADFTAQSFLFLEMYQKDLGLTLGTLSALHTCSNESFLRISHAESVGLVRLYWAIVEITAGVRSLGLLPPVALGIQRPVHRYQRKILLTHPLDTCTLCCHLDVSFITPTVAFTKQKPCCWINTYRLSVSEDACTTRVSIFHILTHLPRAWSVETVAN